MKKLFLSLVALLATTGVWAQQENPMLQPLPTDPELRIGVLENGMRYYIRHNEKPKDLAEFWIVYGVGAIQEDDDQQGLAHFLEHMAFNGTVNLPDKQLLEYCEQVGVAFGRNLNAATSWDYTFYNVSDVPVKRDGQPKEGVIDSMMMILHDWSHFIALKGEEIDSERGVIMEELRTTDGAQRRSSMALIRALGKGTRYAERNLIGHLDFLESFPHSAIRNFYEKWYRPELMTMIIVGDVDVDQIEAKLQKLMHDVPASPADAAQKDVIVIPDNEEPIITIFTDPEMQQTQATIYAKHAALPKEINNTVAAQLVNTIDAFLSQMANARLSEVANQPNAPFLGAYFHNGSVGIIPTLETAMLGVTSKEGELPMAFAAARIELERMLRHGFTVSEFERAKAELKSYVDRQYANRNDNLNRFYVDRCMDNFLKNTPMMDAETEYQLDCQLLEAVQLEMINQRIVELFPDTNLVVAVNAPKKEGLQDPTEEMILAILDQVNQLPDEAVEPYADDTVIEPLVDPAAKLKGSPVVKQEENADMGSIEWTLKNGTRIIVKPTTLKADEVLFNAVASGGSAMIEDADQALIAENFLAALRAQMGVSKFSAIDLQKQLAGKNVNVAPYVGTYSHGLRGSCSPKDLESLMQLTYLTFTAPRYSEDDFQAFYNQYKGFLENMATNPDYLFQKKVYEVLYQNNPRVQVLSLDLLNKVNLEALAQTNAQLFPDANEFTFTFVGNFDIEQLKALTERYIGSIPVNKKAKLALVDDGRKTVKGEVTEHFNVAMQQPKVSLFIALQGDLEYTLENKLTMKLFTEALSKRLRQTVREEMGATYTIGAGGAIDYEPTQEYMIQIGCDTAEEKIDDVLVAIMAEIEKIAQEGPLAEDIDTSREFLLKDAKGSLEQNYSWLTYMAEYYKTSLDYVNDYNAVLTAITYDDVKALARKVLEDKNVLTIVMHPEK